MAVWNDNRNNVRYRINDIDHAPPHCHVVYRGRRLRVALETFEVMSPRGFSLPPTVRRYLRENQLAMLEAWQQVQDMDEL